MSLAEEIKTQLQKSHDDFMSDVDRKRDSFIAEVRSAVTVADEDVRERVKIFLQKQKRSLKDEFSSEAFGFIDTPEDFWCINPVFSESNRDLDGLLKQPAPKPAAALKGKDELHVLPVVSPARMFVYAGAVSKIYFLLYAVVPVCGFIVMFFLLRLINRLLDMIFP